MTRKPIAEIIFEVIEEKMEELPRGYFISFYDYNKAKARFRK